MWKGSFRDRSSRGPRGVAMKFRRARECRFGVRPGTPGRVFVATPHAVWARVPRLQHDLARVARRGTRRSTRDGMPRRPACSSALLTVSVGQKMYSLYGHTVCRPDRILSSWFAARAAAARSPRRARPRGSRGSPVAPARVTAARSCISSRPGYAPAGGMRHGQWRRTTGLRATGGGGRDRPQPANAQRTAQAPRASGDVDVERGARRAVPPSPRVSRTVSTQRQRAPVSARDTTDQITLTGPRSGPAARHRSAAVTRDTTLRSSPDTASRAFHTTWQGDERRQLNMILCL